MRPAVDGELADLAVDRGLYDAAVSHGIDVTRCSAEVERAERPVRLLATATVYTPTLLVALATGSAAARSLSAGLVRIAHHALAVHARDNDYDAEPWIAQAITIARLHVQEEEFDEPRLVERLEAAAEQLCEAIVALASDRMGFPDHLTQAQAAWLTCFRHAS
jgi:hypothetical protein